MAGAGVPGGGDRGTDASPQRTPAAPAAHARREPDAVTRWWRGVTLRAKITGVTVGLITIALVGAGIGTLLFVRTSLIAGQDEQLVTRAGADNGAGMYALETDDSGTITSVTLTDKASSYAVAIYDADGTLVAEAASDEAPAWPATFPYATTIQRGSSPFDLTDAAGKTFRASAGPLEMPGRLYTQMIALPLSPIDRTLRTFLVVYGLLAIAAVIAGVVTTRLLVTRTFRPLGEVEAAAQSIAAGDFGQRLSPGDPRTEVGKLTAAINAMLGAVDSSLADREAALRQMRRFIGDASHELRTPLVSVRGYAELYRIGAISTEEDTDRAMERIEKEAIRMGLMVEDLLALARLDERRDIQLVEIDLRPIAHDAALDVRAAAPERVVTVTDATLVPASPPRSRPGVAPAARDHRRRATTATGALSLLRRRPRPAPEAGADAGAESETAPTPVATPPLVLPPAGRPPVVLGDENRIRQVVANLLGNARRFSPEASPIEITVGTDQARVGPHAPVGMGWIAISDHGEGIPEQIRAHIFERFWRADTSRTRETGGSGLGLAIVASIVEALHGDIEVEDTPGGGATFRVRLPLAPEPTLFLDTQPLPKFSLDED